jgi:putative transcriptional regulator
MVWRDEVYTGLEVDMAAQREGGATMAVEVPPVIINRLSRLMGERRVSIQDVARGTRLAYSAVHDLYHDRTKRYDRETLNRLCAFFRVPVGELLEWQPDDESAGGPAGA